MTCMKMTQDSNALRGHTLGTEILLTRWGMNFGIRECQQVEYAQQNE